MTSKIARFRENFVKRKMRSKHSLDRAVGSGAASEQAAPITIQDFCHVTGRPHDRVVSIQSGPFVDPWPQLRSKTSAFCIMVSNTFESVILRIPMSRKKCSVVKIGFPTWWGSSYLICEQIFVLVCFSLLKKRHFIFADPQKTTNY